MTSRDDAPRPAATAADRSFRAILAVVGGFYVLGIAGLLLADVAYLAASAGAAAAPLPVLQPAWNAAHALAGVFADPNIRHSFALTIVSCLATTVLSLVVAVPLGYVLSRFRFPGRGLVDAILDVPIVLPPLVLGISLLILFQFWPFRLASRHVVFQVPAVILAQFTVSAAFAARIMRVGFDQIDTRQEQVALTLGCTQARAFRSVLLPQAVPAIVTAATIAWARALGEFGPLLVFAGATRMKTEVLSTTVFLELSIGNLTSAVAVTVLMVTVALAVLLVARSSGGGMQQAAGVGRRGSGR